jgi:hypothetical protein
MSRFRRVVPVVLLLVLIPASASAQGLFRWLGKLSGPGPFWGAGTEIRLKCFGVGKDEEKEEKKLKMMMGSIFVRVPCETTLDDRHTTIYFNVAGSIAENNPLFYGDEGRQDKSTAVRLVQAGVSADWTFHRAFDIGAGFGVMYFAGPRFDNFSRGFVQPVRLSVRPIMLRSTVDNNGWLIVSASWQILLGTIDGNDFGAPLDSFRSHNENIPEVGVTIDLIRLVKRFKIGQPRPKMPPADQN